MEQVRDPCPIPSMSGWCRVELVALLATIPAFHLALLSSRIDEESLRDAHRPLHAMRTALDAMRRDLGLARGPA